MDRPGDWETNETILATAQAAGFEPSEKQRKDWRRAGLLPRPVAATGQGRGHGTAYYPPGTGEQLTAICRHSKPKKSLGDLAFLVWWDGFPVDSTAIRERLSTDIDAWQAWWDRWTELPEDTRSDQVWRLATGRLPEPLRSIRHRVGPDRLEAVLRVLIRIVSGQFSDWESADERQAFIEGTGLDRAKHDRIGTASPWLRGLIGEQLQALSATVTPAVLRNALAETANDDGLCQARAELQSLIGVLGTARLMLESVRGSGAFGVGMLPDIRAIDHKLAPHLLLVWLVWRRIPRLSEGYQSLMHLATAGVPLETFANLARSTDK